MRHLVSSLVAAFALVLSTGIGVAQVDLKQDAVVYFGSGSNTTAPATIDESKVRKATPEWQEIQAKQVRRGSARYILLMSEMDKRIRAACQQAAGGAGKDLVVRKDDIDDARGKSVTDLTSDVIQNL
jgi:Skp family chaperone for outer membrane proteins